jgi:shikimate kinase
MGKGERPLLKGKSQEELIAYIQEQLQKREPYYSKAQYTLDVSLMDNHEKINATIDELKNLLGL